MGQNYVSYYDMERIAREIRGMRGAGNGVAPLDESGHVPAANLPSYVDDVLEYATKSAFPAAGESGKIYIAQDTNLTYRWSGTQYVEISQSIALGETASTAYPGDKGSENAEKISTLSKEQSSLKSSISSLESRMNSIDFPTELDHNVPRKTPKDITAYYNDGSLWNRIAGTGGYSLFEDIFVGDYFKMSRAISAYERTGAYQATGSQYVTIAGIDTMWGNGDTNAISYHHLVMVPGQGFGGTQHFGRSRMNPSNVTTGGYKSSEMNTETIGAVATSGSTASDATINQQLYAEFGSHLKTTRELVSNSVNASGYNRFGAASGCSNSWEWIDAQAILMSEAEVYGGIAWSSSGYDIGNANVRLPLFAYSKQAVNNRTAYYWLKSVASGAYFCAADSGGNATYSYASGADAYVRPRFILAA